MNAASKLPKLRKKLESRKMSILLSHEQLHTNIYSIRIQRIHRSYHNVEKCSVKECLFFVGVMAGDLQGEFEPFLDAGAHRI